MYSVQAVADHSNSHVGFYLVVALLLLLSWAVGDSMRASKQGVLPFVIAAVLFAGTGYVSWLASYTDQPPLNEKVIASFEGFTAEVESKQSGKQTTTAHLVYGRFRVPEGIVVLQVSTGYPMPPKVILYKN